MNSRFTPPHPPARLGRVAVPVAANTTDGHPGPIYPTVGAFIRSRSPDEPVFCLSLESAMATARRFCEGFPGDTTYALKACPLPELVTAFTQAGVQGFDVASPQEMALVRSVHAESPLHYNNPIRSDAEVRRAFEEFAIRHYVVDDEVGLNRLNAIIPQDARADIEITVRLRAEKNAAQIDFTAKFGLIAAHAGDLLRAVAASGYKPAITFHPGSQCDDPTAYVDLINAAAAVSKETGIPLHTLNVGGGFPVPYDNAACAQQSAYFEAIDTAFHNHFDPAVTRLVAEPGRALAATTMSLLTQVKHIRADGTIFLNDGMYGGLMELIQIDIKLPMRVWRDDEVLEGPTSGRNVYGPTCCPLDHFPQPLTLPDDIQEGDRIEFGLTGSYGLATVTKFNGYGPSRIVHVSNILTGRN